MFGKCATKATNPTQTAHASNCAATNHWITKLPSHPSQATLVSTFFLVNTCFLELCWSKSEELPFILKCQRPYFQIVKIVCLKNNLLPGTSNIDVCWWCYVNEDVNFLVGCRQNMSGRGSSLIASRVIPHPLTKQQIIIINIIIFINNMVIETNCRLLCIELSRLKSAHWSFAHIYNDPK